MFTIATGGLIACWASLALSPGSGAFVNAILFLTVISFFIHLISVRRAPE